MALLTLLTDFGLADYYVAAVKGTVLRLAPGTQLVDISHDVPPGDLATAAFLLAAAVPAFPTGTVHLAVVDPGVGSDRRILAAEIPTGWLVAPDNGLLTPFLAAGGGARGSVRARVRSVERAGLFPPSPGQTFHGRDRFAPVAAFLLRGGPAADLGPEIADPVRLPGVPPWREEASHGRIVGHVVHVDRYGNLVTDIPTAWLPSPLPPLIAEIGPEIAGYIVTRFVSHYQQIPKGEAALLPGSLGTLELSMNGTDLSRVWGVSRDAEVRVTFA